MNSCHAYVAPFVIIEVDVSCIYTGADPGFDQGGAPDRYRPILPTVRSERSKPGKNRDN